MVQGLRLGVGIALALILAGLGWVAFRRGRQPDAGSYMEHFDELRRRVMWSILAVGIGTMFAFSFRLGDPWWQIRPALHDTLAAQLYAVLANHLVPAGVQLVTLRPMDGLSTELMMSLLFGMAVGMPVVAAHLAAFFAPALRPREARAIRRAVVPATLLFLAGATFAVGWIAPALLTALYGYASALNAQPLLHVGDLITFAATLAVLFGFAFQTPLVMTVLSRAGLVAPATWMKYWRHASVAILFLCALVTDGTIVTLALVTAPILGLYFLGILGARIGARKAAVED